EHARLVPQSTLITFDDGNHFLPWSHTEPVAEAIGDFVASVESGDALTRGTASPERLARVDIPWEQVPKEPATGEPLAILLLLLVAGTLITEDFTCVAAGLLVAERRLTATTAIVACFAGIYIGDLLLFSVGRWARSSLERPPLRWIAP